MKNLLIVLAIFTMIFTSCSKDSKIDPNPEPTIDYKSMEPKVKEVLFDYQTALNEKDYKKVFEIIKNKDRLEFGVYPTPSVASQASSKIAITRTFSEVVQKESSSASSGTLIFTGKQKIVTKKTGVADKELLLNFTATFKCVGDKMTLEDWKLNFKATK